MASFAAVGSRRGREQLLDIDGIESISPIAEVAADLDLSPLGQDRANLFRTQAAKHPDHALARATAAEIHRRRLEQTHVVLGKQTPQDVAIAQRLQFFAAQGIAKQLHAAPGVIDLVTSRQLDRPTGLRARVYAVVRQAL